MWRGGGAGIGDWVVVRVHTRVCVVVVVEDERIQEQRRNSRRRLRGCMIRSVHASLSFDCPLLVLLCRPPTPLPSPQACMVCSRLLATGPTASSSAWLSSGALSSSACCSGAFCWLCVSRRTAAVVVDRLSEGSKLLYSTVSAHFTYFLLPCCGCCVLVVLPSPLPRSLANEVCTVDEAKAVYPFMGE